MRLEDTLAAQRMFRQPVSCWLRRSTTLFARQLEIFCFWHKCKSSGHSQLLQQCPYAAVICDWNTFDAPSSLDPLKWTTMAACQ